LVGCDHQSPRSAAHPRVGLGAKLLGLVRVRARGHLDAVHGVLRALSRSCRAVMPVWSRSRHRALASLRSSTADRKSDTPACCRAWSTSATAIGSEPVFFSHLQEPGEIKTGPPPIAPRPRPLSPCSPVNIGEPGGADHALVLGQASAVRTRATGVCEVCYGSGVPRQNPFVRRFAYTPLVGLSYGAVPFCHGLRPN